MQNMKDRCIVALSVLKGGYVPSIDSLEHIKAWNRNTDKSLPIFMDFIKLKRHFANFLPSYNFCSLQELLASDHHDYFIRTQYKMFWRVIDLWLNDFPNIACSRTNYLQGKAPYG